MSNSGSESEQELYQSLLDKHIERKINAMLKRKLGQNRGSAENSSMDTDDSEMRPIVKAGIIPEFDPDSKNCTVTAWLQKIEQLGQIHNWSNYEKTCFMQIKLRGSAREWFNRLENYDKTWDEWKMSLSRAFPRCVDYATVLEELVARRKRSDETMTHYYHAKVSLTQQCRLDNEATISCIIKGLPLELQANARAFQCSSPDELYSGFIAPMDNYQTPSGSTPAKRPRYDTEISANKRKSQQCYYCGKLGHIARDCRNKNIMRCHYCNRPGHKREDCHLRQQSKMKISEINEKHVKLIDSNRFNDIYKKQCTIGGQTFRAYLDTGSQANIISSSAVAKLQLPTTSKASVLRGFGGSKILSDRETTFLLKLDELSLSASAIVTDADMGDIDIIIGQPVINKEGVSFTVEMGESKLTEHTTDMLNKINPDEDEPRPTIVLEEDALLKAGTCTPVHISVIGVEKEIDVVFSNNVYQLNRALICIPGGIFRASSTYLPVLNLGDQDVAFKKDRVLGRGERCMEAQEVTNLTVSLCKPDSINIDLGNVDMDDSLTSSVRRRLLEILNKWASCFAQNSKELGTLKLGELDIALEKNSKPICYRPYRLSFKEREVVRDKVLDLLKAGIIRESDSNFASPVVLVKKKNGDYRLCVDYRGLNKITVKDIYPMPCIEEQLNKLANRIYFTSLDCSTKGVSNKLRQKFSGPYIVIKVFGGDRYRIKSVRGMRGYKNFSTTVPVDSLRPFNSTIGEISGESGSDDSDNNVRDRDDLIDLLEG